MGSVYMAGEVDVIRKMGKPIPPVMIKRKDMSHPIRLMPNYIDITLIQLTSVCD